MWDKQSRFTVLVEAFSNDLYRYAYWLCLDREIAEDLVQETFARAWRSLDSLRDDKAAKSWLMTILRRENARRFEKKQLERADTDLTQVSDPNRGYDTSTEAFVLRRALAELPKEYSEPLVMQVVGNYTCEDIAKMLDLSPAAVMTRLFRARKKLREKLVGSEGQETVSK